MFSALKTSQRNIFPKNYNLFFENFFENKSLKLRKNISKSLTNFGPFIKVQPGQKRSEIRRCGEKYIFSCFCFHIMSTHQVLKFIYPKNVKFCKKNVFCIGRMWLEISQTKLIRRLNYLSNWYSISILIEYQWLILEIFEKIKWVFLWVWLKFPRLI